MRESNKNLHMRTTSQPQQSYPQYWVHAAQSDPSPTPIRGLYQWPDPYSTPVAGTLLSISPHE